MGKLTRHDLCTPALICDLDVFESNLKKMADHTRARGIHLRPHAKSHKCPEIARRQIAAGAVGVCVATLREAEVMAEAGVPDILITSELVGEVKVKRLLNLVERHPDIMVVVDHAANVRELGEAAEAHKIRLKVLIEIDVGTQRTGTAPGAPTLELAQAIARTPHLQLVGVQAYAGHASHTVGFEQRKAAEERAMTQAFETQQLLKKNGIAADLITGGCTGTYNIESQLPFPVELQAGSYIFMDVNYRRIGGRGGDTFDDFGCSLTVLTTVISRPQPMQAIIDAGFKAFATDRAYTPDCKTVGGITYSWCGDEHGKLNLAGAEREVRLGDRLEFIVPHCDPNVNLYDSLYVVRGEEVAAIWPIAARGYSPG